MNKKRKPSVASTRARSRTRSVSSRRTTRKAKSPRNSVPRRELAATAEPVRAEEFPRKETVTHLLSFWRFG